MTRFQGKDRFEVSDELGNTRTFEDSQVRVEQIMDQKDLVDDRQQNIREIADMMTKVNQISKEMNTLIYKQDEKLDSIHKHQDQIQDNARTAVQDMVETDNLTRKKLKKIALWAAAVILLGLCVVGLVYIIKSGSKDDKKTQLNALKLHSGASFGPFERAREAKSRDDWQIWAEVEPPAQATMTVETRVI